MNVYHFSILSIDNGPIVNLNHICIGIDANNSDEALGMANRLALQFYPNKRTHIQAQEGPIVNSVNIGDMVLSKNVQTNGTTPA